MITSHISLIAFAFAQCAWSMTLQAQTAKPQPAKSEPAETRARSLQVDVQSPRANLAMPVLKLSKPDWTADEPFSVYPTIRQLENGTIIVADAKDVEVRLLGTNGQTLRPLGRKGSGPGEYSRPTKLMALTHDSTLLLDRSARRVLVIDPSGKFTATQPIPSKLGEGSEWLASADVLGRVYFRYQAEIKKGDPPQEFGAIARWSRDKDAFDTASIIKLDVPKLQNLPMPSHPEVTRMVVRRRVAFAAEDDWVAAPSGRVAIIHAAPYHVEWYATNGAKIVGETIPYTPVPVTEKDKKYWEPNGPPFIRDYPKTKSPFEAETAVVDESENVWVRRHDAFGSAVRRWDVFDPKGKLLGTQLIPAARRILAINRKYVYLSRTDADELVWLERFSR